MGTSTKNDKSKNNKVNYANISMINVSMIIIHLDIRHLCGKRNCRVLIFFNIFNIFYSLYFFKQIIKKNISFLISLETA